MKVLIVCSGNVENFNFILHHAFVYEQIESVKNYHNIEYDTFFIRGKGILGYLKNLKNMKKKIDKYAPDFVHAHFGLSGLLACLQRKVPAIVTYHGSDANRSGLKQLSRIAAKLSSFNIFVSEKIQRKINGKEKYSIVPCGIDFDIFQPMEMRVAREKLNMDQNKKYILFASSFNNSVKNAPLAFSAIENLPAKPELIELKNKSRVEVNLLLNACDILLLTSISEGSPQVIKEAMACNRPIVATDVGDIRDITSGTDGCFITSFDPKETAEKISKALKFDNRTDGRKKVMHFDNKLIAKKIYEIYQLVGGKKK